MAFVKPTASVAAAYYSSVLITCVTTVGSAQSSQRLYEIFKSAIKRVEREDRQMRNTRWEDKADNHRNPTGDFLFPLS